MLARRQLGQVLPAVSLLLLLSGCDSGPDWSALLSCPEGDTPWEMARDEARAGDRLAELGAVADAAAEACPERWEPRWVLAETVFLSRSGDPEADYREALRLARAAADDVGVSRSVNRLGWLAFDRGDLAAAERLYREALDASRRAEREDLAAFALGNLAGALVVAGDFAAGQRVLAEASRTLEALGREHPSAVTRMNRGIVQLELGDVNGARENLERAHARLEDMGDRAMAALAACQLGKLHVLTRDFEAADAWLDRVSVDLAEWAVAEVHRARGLLARGRLDEAAERLDAAIAATPSEVTRLFAGLDRAEVDLRRGRLDEARARLDKILAQSSQATEIEWWARWLLARIALAESDVEEAQELLRLAVASIDGMGDGLDPRDQGLRWLRGRAEPVADLAAVLAASGGSHDELFAVMETAHARSLRRLLSGSSAAAPHADLETLRGKLADGEVVLSFLIGEERGAALIIRRDGIAARPTRGWNTLREPVRLYREALTGAGAGGGDVAGVLKAGRDLAERLMAPLAPWIEGARRVYVVPDRDLALLPPAALPLPANGGDELRFLGAVSETAVLPLAGAPPRWPRRSGPLLLAGDPLPDEAGEFPQLTFAARELSRIGALWPGASVRRLEGAAFTREAFVDADVGRFGTVHLATHALASSLDPRRCAVVFSRGERLGFDEIAALPLGPSLVVLSACRTGEGELVPGEGVLGLGWAFLQAGARGVAASLWSVEDASTAAMMVAFHRHMRSGDDPVRALARARREVRAEHPHPAFWAPFVLLLGPGR